MRRCEICGQPVREASTTIMIDGGYFNVCGNCSRLGTPAPPRRQEASLKAIPRLGSPSKPKPPRSRLLEPEVELKPDFHQVIRQAREKAGLSQEDLGRKINEKPSVIKLLESGRLKPDNALAGKIRHFLKVELFAPLEEM